MIGGRLPAGWLRATQPPEAHCEHAAVPAVVRFLEARIGHVHIAVLEHQSALRLEEILDAEAALGGELGCTTEFRCARGQRSALGPAAEFEERHETPVILAVKPKENRPAVQASPRVNGVAENPLTYYFEAPDRKVRHIEVFHDESYLRLCHQ